MKCMGCGMQVLENEFHPAVYCWLWKAGYEPRAYILWAYENEGQITMDTSPTTGMVRARTEKDWGRG